VKKGATSENPTLGPTTQL